MARKRGAHDHNQADLFDTLAAQIERHAERFATELRRAAERASSEEDIRVAVERQLALVAAELGVEIEGQHEYTLLRGRIDSVYGAVFVEYKNPSAAGARLGSRLSSPGTQQVVEQIRKRFTDVATLTGRRGVGMLGIGCDGKYFVFVRFLAGEIAPDEPVEVSFWSARRFLWALFNLGTRGFALSPQALAEDFGSESDLARRGVGALAEAARDHADEPRVSTFFRQWRVLFGEVCGYDLANPRPELQELARYYGCPPERASELLFALHTYYALFMKLLAAHVASFFQRMGGSPLSAIARAPSETALRDRLRELEEGGVFRHLGVTNFLEGDLFAWYLSAWSSGIEDAVRRVADRLLQYNPGSLRDNPTLARDLLKKLYHELFPRTLRHRLGEYYTPDWLAQLTLDRAGYDGNPRTRVLDPACGSGTFLVLALARVQGWLERNVERAPTDDRMAQLAAANIVGFDLNPLAVLAARTNYLIQFYELFNYRGALEVPVYLCDSVLTPSEYADTGQEHLTERPVRVPTSAKLFLVPREVTTHRDTLVRYCNLLAEYARERSGFSAADFVGKCRDEGVPVSSAVEHEHRQLFEDVRGLDRDRRNGVWARFIKNAFAPVFLKSEPVDLVVGNPPWVNWESLPGRMGAEGEPNYRQQIAEVFQRYGLFSLTGGAGRLGGGKKDLSMVFAYACIDHYLQPGGKLAFVITQTIFKTKGAGDGFRRFQYDARTGARGRPARVNLNVVSVDDLSDFQPFEGATNRTAVFVCQKCQPTRYPVRYTVWSKTRRGRIDPNSPLSEVEDATARAEFGAVPVNRDERTSPWLTAPRAVLTALKKVIGKSDYQAQAGCCTWLNGVFWVNVLREVPDGVLIENLSDVGKIDVERVRCAVEEDLLYPLLRGRDVQRWRAEPSAWMLLTQDPRTRRGIPESTMRRRWPKTFTYLKRFEAQLRGRSGYRKYFDASDPFYTVYNVGPHTMSPWKVLWPEVGNTVRAAACGPAAPRRRQKPALADHTIIAVACDDADEAYYLSAALNCAPAQIAVRGYIVMHPSPHVLEHVGIPRYKPRDKTHSQLAELSGQAHAAAQHKRTAGLLAIEEQIDRCAARLWGLTTDELAAVRGALRGPEAPEDMPLLPDILAPPVNHPDQ
jgi:hypothetical protein